MKKRNEPKEHRADLDPAGESGDFAAEMDSLLLTIQGCVSLLLKEMTAGEPGYDKLLQIQEAARQGMLQIEQLRQRTDTADGEEMKTRALSAEIIHGDETILLVDNEEGIIDVTRDMLEMMGYQVLTAPSGGEAVRICQDKEIRIDLVLLDMILSDMDGGEVFDRLQAIRPDLPVILASGFSFNGQVQKIMARGCRAFLQKPFGMVELSRKIRQVLDGTK